MNCDGHYNQSIGVWHRCGPLSDHRPGSRWSKRRQTCSTQYTPPLHPNPTTYHKILHNKQKHQKRPGLVARWSWLYSRRHARFGREAWQRNADVFATNRYAWPLRAKASTSDRAAWGVPLFGRGGGGSFFSPSPVRLGAPRGDSGLTEAGCRLERDGLAFVLAMLSTVIFDGLWGRHYGRLSSTKLGAPCR